VPESITFAFGKEVTKVDTTPLNRRGNSCLRSPHSKQPSASVYSGAPIYGFFFHFFCQSMPRKQAGSLVPAALWWATQAQQCPCRGQSFGQGHDMW